MNRISTHVLDTSLGRPASGVPARLERLESSGAWLELAFGRTDEDGRCAQLLPPDNSLKPGQHRITFDTGSYYAGQGVSGLYPVVEIIFEVRAGESQFHIPLLLSPNSYTTYRGS
jgi:5-hydroxyisourate hydrolase